MSRLTTKQRRARARRRGSNGEFKGRFLGRAERQIAKAMKRMGAICTRYFFEGIPVEHMASWLP